MAYPEIGHAMLPEAARAIADRALRGQEPTPQEIMDLVATVLLYDSNRPATSVFGFEISDPQT